ncbi:hypothetical protein chiPu_0029126 [Chiloscyllium punctatum]|uniref:Uncharacterized protein n=1 Tax=Chiloscyllium punctatum TaxID=137246 RepID=A0A401TQ03_CHIPU|nr:hypothetical protein [Chiloscyllium punctatum]
MTRTGILGVIPSSGRTDTHRDPWCNIKPRPQDTHRDPWCNKIPRPQGHSLESLVEYYPQAAMTLTGILAVIPSSDPKDIHRDPWGNTIPRPQGHPLGTLSNTITRPQGQALGSLE